RKRICFTHLTELASPMSWSKAIGKHGLFAAELSEVGLRDAITSRVEGHRVLRRVKLHSASSRRRLSMMEQSILFGCGLELPTTRFISIWLMMDGMPSKLMRRAGEW